VGSRGECEELRFTQLLIVAALSLGLAACTTVAGPGGESVAADPSATAPAFPQITATVQHTDVVKYYPSDEPLRAALEHFNRGHYGLAERYFQDAVERAPKDPTAWIGLAACYDRLGRFDFADRSYAAAIRLVGETAEILNNEGYSYMLRGDLVRARQKLSRAYALDPHNPTILNNMKLLNGSYRHIKRGA
jgi:Flp pilus assembly protein TadD